jgi:hypothetical protein
MEPSEGRRWKVTLGGRSSEVVISGWMAAALAYASVWVPIDTCEQVWDVFKRRETRWSG